MDTDVNRFDNRYWYKVSTIVLGTNVHRICKTNIYISERKYCIGRDVRLGPIPIDICCTTIGYSSPATLGLTIYHRYTPSGLRRAGRAQPYNIITFKYNRQAAPPVTTES